MNAFTIFSLITIAVIFFIFFDFQFDYIQSRFMNAITFSDGSTRGRIIGGFLSFIDVLQNQPFSGYGAGNLNQYNNIDSSVLIEKYSTLSGNNVYLNNTTYLSAISIASGIFPVLLIYSIFIYSLLKRYYFYSLIMFSTTIVSGLYYYPAFWISLVIFCYYVNSKKLH